MDLERGKMNSVQIAEEIKRVFEENKLFCADLRGMEQINAELCAAILYGKNLWSATNIPFIPCSCPSDGEFTAWKKGQINEEEEVLIKLTIPADARRTSGTTRMSRADKAWCDDITSLDGKTHYKECESLRFGFHYYAGEMAEADGFDDDRKTDYCHGIHFFIDKEEALRY